MPPSPPPHSRCPGKGRQSSTGALQPQPRRWLKQSQPELLQSLGQPVRPAPASASLRHRACRISCCSGKRTCCRCAWPLQPVLHLQGQRLKSDRPVGIMALKVVESAKKLVRLDALRRGCLSESLKSGQASPSHERTASLGNISYR